MIAHNWPRSSTHQKLLYKLCLLYWHSLKWCILQRRPHLEGSHPIYKWTMKWLTQLDYQCNTQEVTNYKLIWSRNHIITPESLTVFCNFHKAFTNKIPLEFPKLELLSQWRCNLTKYSKRAYLNISQWGITERSQWANMVSSQETNSATPAWWAHSKLMVWVANSQKAHSVRAHLVSSLWGNWVSSKWAFHEFQCELSVS